MHAVCSRHTGLTMWVLALPSALNRIDDTNHQAGCSQEQLHRGHFSRVADPSWTAADLRRNPIRWLLHLTRIDPLATDTKPHRRGLEVHYLDSRRQRHQDPRRVHRNPAGTPGRAGRARGLLIPRASRASQSTPLASVFIIMQCIFVYVPLSYPQCTASLLATNDFFAERPGLRKYLVRETTFHQPWCCEGCLEWLKCDWYLRYVWSLDLRREVESEIEVRDFVT
jgi:hypothetical protein